MNIDEEVKAFSSELIELRRNFHSHPEIGFKEFRTSGIIADYLESLGMEVRKNIAGTGVSALLKGHEEGARVLLRSDMDALPVREETGLDFASENEGVMHACGHDGHMAMLLVAAKILSSHTDRIKGSILFVFQPNEEEAGAEKMIEDGLFEDGLPDGALGIHLWSPLPTGTIGINAGPIMAASHYFYITVKGKGGHAGIPHKAVDPVDTAAKIVEDMQHLQTRELDALEEPTVIMFTGIHGGSAPTVVPSEVELMGSIRFLHDREEFLHRRFEETVSHICSMTGTDHDLKIVTGNRLLSNHPELTELVLAQAENTVGRENISGNMRMMVGEDFAEFSRRIDSAFYFVGTGNREKGTDISHHHPHFNIDEDSLATGVKMHVRTALAFLDKKASER